ncbi:GlxA family transcriptional regulator [Dyadobacter sp. CY326]|uniref:GlxA family transcriptional regulator n=1 Tax=Dyadobacter sp. CY326 TaxID=2907300 RepID=UPI001F273603|nr:helix-turn-helix domain-containing protein [Dyadobacter sp. CY326]MCE7067124.1 helix-turn-helix domain-containing protein [Dyadobacter sp. CY326]
MKRITILVPEGQNNLSSIVGSYKILKRANSFWKEKQGRELYHIQLAGTSDEVDFHEGLFTVRPHVHISAISKTNLIIIPSLNHAYQQAVEKNDALIQWISEQYRGGSEIASICTGAFLLASSGLISGKTCSTHWAFAESLKTMFPDVDVQTDKLITDENGIYTNGGAYSFLHLIIYLVEKYFDRQTAIFCSKVFQIDIDRESQSPFIIFAGQKSHDDQVVKQAQHFIENNLQNKISMVELASRFAVGRRNFDRRFIKATGNTPIEYVQRVKIEAAKKSFETNSKNVKEVMYETGYSDMKAFREVFRKVTGISPLEYRQKYNKEAFH